MKYSSIKWLDTRVTHPLSTLKCCILLVMYGAYSAFFFYFVTWALPMHYILTAKTLLIPVLMYTVRMNFAAIVMANIALPG